MEYKRAAVTLFNKYLTRNAKFRSQLTRMWAGVMSREFVESLFK